jgi:hypothetical protein
MPPRVVHDYAWQALYAIDSSKDAYLDNIKSPIHATAEQLSHLELGFAEQTDLKLQGTIVAGDGIVFQMQLPTSDQVDSYVTSYYTGKGYYTYGLQVSHIIVVDITTFLLQVSSFLFSFPGFL